MDTQIKIFIVDDHAVLRAGLRMLLNAEEDMCVVGEAGAVAMALPQLAALQPGVVLVDISMPDMSGLDGLKEMKQAAPDSKFLILTMHNDVSYLRMALSFGAAGYVLKQAANEDLLSAIRVVQQGGVYLHDNHRAMLFEQEPALQKPPASAGETDAYNRLSPREKEIFRLIAMGYTNRQAAEELFLSEKTIETYKSRLMAKLSMQSRIDLVRYALRLGLIKS